MLGTGQNTGQNVGHWPPTMKKGRPSQQAHASALRDARRHWSPAGTGLGHAGGHTGTISEPCRDRKPLEPKTSCYVSLQNHIPFFSAVSQAPTGNVLATEGDSTAPRISEEGKKQCFDPQA